MPTKEELKIIMRNFAVNWIKQQSQQIWTTKKPHTDWRWKVSQQHRIEFWYWRSLLKPSSPWVCRHWKARCPTWTNQAYFAYCHSSLNTTWFTRLKTDVAYSITNCAPTAAHVTTPTVTYTFTVNRASALFALKTSRFHTLHYLMASSPPPHLSL